MKHVSSLHISLKEIKLASNIILGFLFSCMMNRPRGCCPEDFLPKRGSVPTLWKKYSSLPVTAAREDFGHTSIGMRAVPTWTRWAMLILFMENIWCKTNLYLDSQTGLPTAQFTIEFLRLLKFAFNLTCHSIQRYSIHWTSREWKMGLKGTMFEGMIKRQRKLYWSLIDFPSKMILKYKRSSKNSVAPDQYST